MEEIIVAQVPCSSMSAIFSCCKRLLQVKYQKWREPAVFQTKVALMQHLMSLTLVLYVVRELLNCSYEVIRFFIFLLQVPYHPEEQTAMQLALAQQLGGEYISQRSGAGGQKVCIRDFTLSTFVFSAHSVSTCIPHLFLNVMSYCLVCC